MMSARILAIVAVCAGCAGLGGARAEPPSAPHVAAIDTLAWLVGEWEGQATMQTREGASRMLSWEGVQRAAGGTVLLIQGRHDRLREDGSRGERVHDAAAMLSYDAKTGRYVFESRTQGGRGGTFDATVEGGVLSWFIPLPDGRIRYDIRLNAAGQWEEVGSRCAGSDPCRPFFRMTLDRKR